MLICSPTHILYCALLTRDSAGGGKGPSVVDHVFPEGAIISNDMRVLNTVMKTTALSKIVCKHCLRFLTERLFSWGVSNF